MESLAATLEACWTATRVPDSNFQYFHDKESVTADPTRAGTAYVVWDVLIGPNMSVEADLHAAAFTDFTLFSRYV